MHISIIVCIEFGVLEPYKMSGVPDIYLHLFLRYNRGSCRTDCTPVKWEEQLIIQLFFCLYVTRTLLKNRETKHLPILISIILFNIKDDNSASCFFLLSKKVIFILIFHNINERGSETKRVDELKNAHKYYCLYRIWGFGTL